MMEQKKDRLVSEELPQWYYTSESVLGDTNTKLQDVVTNPQDTLYGQLYFDNGGEIDLVTQKILMKNCIIVMTTMLTKARKEHIPQ